MGMTVEVPELPELTFDEASHIYRLNGDIIPSVSKLMEPLKDQCYGGISKRTLENAAIKGSAVHNSIENWIKFGIDDIPSEHRGYFNGFMEWWKQYKPRVFGSEVRIYHKLMRYGGTIDLLCEIGGLLELIDFKTTYTLLEMACGVQLEAYSQALISHGITPQRKHILHLKKDGKWAFREFPAKDPARCRVVGALKCLYDYEQSYNWCSEAEVVEERRCADWGHEQIARGGALVLHDVEDIDEKWELDLKKFLNGFKLWVEQGLDEYGAVQKDGTVDCCQIDAACADEIVQLALFGEVTFG